MFLSFFSYSIFWDKHKSTNTSDHMILVNPFGMYFLKKRVARFCVDSHTVTDGLSSMGQDRHPSFASDNQYS